MTRRTGGFTSLLFSAFGAGRSAFGSASPNAKTAGGAGGSLRGSAVTGKGEDGGAEGRVERVEGKAGHHCDNLSETSLAEFGADSDEDDADDVEDVAAEEEGEANQLESEAEAENENQTHNEVIA